MAEQGTLAAHVREQRGSSNARRLRAEGKIPGVIYDAGNATTAIALKTHDLETELHRHSSENVVLDIDVDGAGLTKVLVKEVQRHPVTGKIFHVDLQVVSLTETLQVPVPIHLEGEPVGVTQFGGVLEQLLREAEVECLPADIPEALVVDVSHLKIGEAVTLAAIPLDPAKVVLIGDPKIAVAHVAAPRVEIEAGAEGEEAPAAAAEPEVIGGKGGEDEEA